jgi:DNA (cytosine-5)-methyltransferase 1
VINPETLQVSGQPSTVWADASGQGELFGSPAEGSPFSDLCSVLGVEPGPAWVDQFGAAIRSTAEESGRRPVRTLSLFSGGGGLDIGFHDAGFEIVEMVEIEERFVASLMANSGPGRYLGSSQATCIDIAKYQPKRGMKVDFVIGGPPCQTFSAAGRRAAGVQGTDDERGLLFRHYVRLLDALRPAGFLFENVYGITGAQEGKAWQEITRAFEAAGYQISARVLDAADYGVPQHRERMFIVGSRTGKFRFPTPTHGPDSPSQSPFYAAGTAVRHAKLSEHECQSGIGGRYGHLLTEVPPGLNYSFFTAEMGHPNPVFAWRSKFSDFLYKATPDCPVRTIKAQGGQYTGPFHWDSRPFAASELKRLQTFPDAYQLVGGRQVVAHQLGNSVPPQIARVLALSILNQFFGRSLPVSLPTLEPGALLGFRRRKRLLTNVYRAVAAKELLGTKSQSRNRHAVASRKYSANISEDFAWAEARTGEWRVHFKPSEKCWEFVIHSAREKVLDFASVEISAVPGASNWNLPVNSVRFVLKSKVPTALLVAWKGFEQELIRGNYKADLVQLSGYYQYPSALRSHMEFAARTRPTPTWKVLDAVTRGAGVRETLATNSLAMQWSIAEDGVLRSAKWLRKLGFEVRNRNTNPQIRAGHFLVPYAFPTLTPVSVQLRKSL